MKNDRAAADKILDQYRRQVLRWNRQINLVTRQNTPAHLGSLIGQCRDAWDNLVGHNEMGLMGADSLWYFDLGSGAGLPGIVWHARMLTSGLPVRTLLVEPREKRAWFLARMKNLIGPQALQVAAGRWGEVSVDGLFAKTAEPGPSHVLVSLKALHLSDAEVLGGLVPFLEAREGPPGAAGDEIRLLIARFYPSGQQWDERLAAELDIPATGGIRHIFSGRFHSEGGRVLQPATPRGAALVLSGYGIRID